MGVSPAEVGYWSHGTMSSAMASPMFTSFLPGIGEVGLDLLPPFTTWQRFSADGFVKRRSSEGPESSNSNKASCPVVAPAGPFEVL